MASRDSLQFVRFAGYKQGPPGKRHTVGSILAEGLRKPSHISHLPGAPRFSVTPLGDQVDDPQDLPGWIAEEMAQSRNQVTIKGKLQERKIRSDATAIGTIIASLPETLADYDEERFSLFCEDTTDWARDFLSVRDYMLHFRLEHLDELHPHLHLWFTPKASGEREGNWSFNNLFGDTSKAFYHNLLENFYHDVGHKYFDNRARPSSERKKRMPRHFAIQQRDSQDRDVLRKMRDGSLAQQSGTTHSAPADDTISRDKLSEVLGGLRDDEIDALPAVRDRLKILGEGHSRKLEESHSQQLKDSQRQQQTLESQLKQGQQHQQSLESQLARLREDQAELKQSNMQLQQRLTDDVSGVSELRSEKKALYAGATVFMSSGIWDHIVKAVMESAYNNANRSYHVSQSDWEGLVIDDALPRILPENNSQHVEDVEYWLSQAVKGMYASKLRDSSGSSFEAFPDANPLGHSEGVPDGGVTPKGKGGSRFRKAAAETDAAPQDLWPSR